MEREWALGISNATTEPSGAAEAFVPPSRVSALDLCRGALESEAGPVLITGEAGIGKTWLWRRLATGLEGARRFAAVDLTPATDPAWLFRAIGYRMSLCVPDRGAEMRLNLAYHLDEESADGRRWVLIIDEAHNLSEAVLEEVRIISNGLGRSDGFLALVLVGQTRLARRFATQPLAALETRLAARAHLRAIDADEAREYLMLRWPDRAWERAEVDRLHRDAGGNPAKLVRLAQRALPIVRRTTVTGGSPKAAEPVEAASGDFPSSWTATPAMAPLLGPAKPPIHVEDGLIEVGWDPALDESQTVSERPVASTIAAEAPSQEQRAGSHEEVSEETVNDHYAALQAWNEWAQNQGRLPATPTAQQVSPEVIEGADEEIKTESESPASHSHIWAEGPDNFAPYSQLFSRVKQPKDPD